MVTMVAVLAVGIHPVVAAAFGTEAVGEPGHTHQVASCLCTGMVLIGNRNFAAYKFSRGG